ncbi:B-box zinc finger protein [Pyxidicoccus xibeiensis]|uniref:B-box zinc finger protein n=1 Tax=Pyxidicoccus xibeiensis TaxID=2906759 RepID=UPI0020A6EDF3|nr:B-box zinc finger protein [Pyxidicoccus xibeiensis]MCP3141279.1 hypothetical protein [Pyxidicoccus xibeiensis]
MNALPFDVLAPSSSPPRCKKHPEAPAGWRCQDCDSALCPDCAVGRRAQTVELVGCGLCGGGALPLLGHRSRVPLASRLTRAWRYVFTASGLQVLMAVSLSLALLGWMLEMTVVFLKVLPLAMYGSMFWGTFFTLVRDTSRGHTELETPEFTDFFRDAVLPGFRGLSAVLVVWLPAGLYGVFARPGGGAFNLEALAGFTEGGFSTAVWADPVFWVLVLLGVVWLPMALLLTAAGHPITSVLNVVGVVQRARLLGRDYLLTSGVLVGLAGLHLAAHGLASGVRWLNVVLLSRVLAEGLTLVVPFTAAHVLGLLLYVRGDALGYGVARDYLEPVLGETKPRRAAPPMSGAAPLPEDGAAPVVVENATQKAASEGLAALATAVDARDVPQAMALYSTLRAIPKVRVPPAHHLFIGQAAAVEGNFPLAVQALESAADVAPDDPTAPRALVLLARVLGERMQDAARAEEVYRYVLHRYPDSSAARFARERVTPSSD